MSLGNRKLNYDLHSFITSVFADLNSFIKNHVTEKVERLNMIFGNHSNPQRKTGIYLLFTNYRVTSSDANLPTFPMMALVDW